MYLETYLNIYNNKDMKWYCRHGSKTTENVVKNVAIIPIIPVTNKDSPLQQEYVYNKNRYIKSVEKLDCSLCDDTKLDSIEIGKAIDKIFTYFIDNYDMKEYNLSNNNIKKEVWKYFIACFWIIDKYCHDEYLGARDISNFTGIDRKQLIKAEITVLAVVGFDFRKYFTCVN